MEKIARKTNIKASIDNSVNTSTVGDTNNDSSTTIHANKTIHADTTLTSVNASHFEGGSHNHFEFGNMGNASNGSMWSNTGENKKLNVKKFMNEKMDTLLNKEKNKEKDKGKDNNINNYSPGAENEDKEEQDIDVTA